MAREVKPLDHVSSISLQVKKSGKNPDITTTKLMNFYVRVVEPTFFQTLPLLLDKYPDHPIRR